jgi:hypothetical protein
MTSVKRIQVTFDCAEPEHVARDDNESCIPMQDIEGNELDLESVAAKVP